MPVRENCRKQLKRSDREAGFLEENRVKVGHITSPSADTKRGARCAIAKRTCAG